MAQVEVVGDRLVIRLDRADRLWSFRSELQVPLAHIRGVEVDPDQARLRPGAACRSGASVGGCQA